MVPSPLCTNINSSSTESYKNDAETNGLDPESITANPPNRTLGSNVLTVIKLVPMFNTDSEIYCIEAEPSTVRLFETSNEPVITTF